MKKITVVILIILLSGVAPITICAKHKHKKKQQLSPDIISVGIYHTPCYGRCPSYKIEIYNDGTAIYTGLRFTHDTGAFKKNIGAEKAMEIINQFNVFRVDTCSNMYKTRVPDIAGLIITVKYNDSTKTIRDANFGPRFLKLLANAIDATGMKTDTSWTKIDNVTKER